MVDAINYMICLLANLESGRHIKNCDKNVRLTFRMKTKSSKILYKLELDKMYIARQGKQCTFHIDRRKIMANLEISL
jgi:hypothetical protein